MAAKTHRHPHNDGTGTR